VRRREFISLLGGAATWPIAAAKPQQSSVRIIGFLGPGSPDANVGAFEGFRRGLAESGYVEGRNIHIETRWSGTRYELLPELARDLVSRHVEVLAACGSSEPGLAAKAATTTIPIVFQTGSDPVADGLVASMNRPGGNVTGVSRMTVALDPKRLELLHEAVPKANVLGLLVYRQSSRAGSVIQQARNSARSLGSQMVIQEIDNESELENAFAAMARQEVGALLAANDPVMLGWREKIAALALQRAIPTMFGNRAYVATGGLMSYDSDLADSYRQVGVYVGRVLGGEKPSDLPILEPTKFEFVLNLRTAKALSLDIPLKLHAFADEVIE
jgi:putative ABC transport system substrate-binding protein